MHTPANGFDDDDDDDAMGITGVRRCQIYLCAITSVLLYRAPSYFIIAAGTFFLLQSFDEVIFI